MATRNTLVVLGGGDYGMYEFIHGAGLHQALADRYDLMVVKSKAKAEKVLASPSTRVVFVTDADIAMKTKLALQEFVDRGGALVLAGVFPSMITPKDHDDLFQRLGVAWRRGDYFRTTDSLAPAARERFAAAPLPAAYSSKATRIVGVAPSDIVFAPSDGAQLESAVFAPQPVSNTHVAAAFGRCGAGGRGWLGYCGDNNNEAGTTQVVLAMCGEAFKQ